MNIASHFRSLRCTSQAAFEAQELPGELETQQAWKNPSDEPTKTMG